MRGSCRELHLISLHGLPTAQRSVAKWAALVGAMLPHPVPVLPYKPEVVLAGEP